MPSAAKLRRLYERSGGVGTRTYLRSLGGFLEPSVGSQLGAGFRPGVSFDLLDRSGTRLGWGKVAADGTIELFDAESNRLGSVRPTFGGYARGNGKRYAAPVEALKEGEVLEIGPEGKRGVWRSIGANPIFIEVARGESVPEAVRRAQTGAISSGQQGLAGKGPRVGGDDQLVLARQNLSAGFELAKVGTPEFAQQLAKEVLLDKDIHRRLGKVALFSDPISESAAMSFRANADVLGAWTAKTGREVGVLIDNRTGQLVGPVSKGGKDVVLSGIQFEQAESTGDYSHLHTHPAPAGFSDLDIQALTSIPMLRRIAVRAADGRTYVLSKRIGVKYGRIKDDERIPKFNMVQGQLRRPFGEAVLRASGRQFMDDITTQDLKKPKIVKLWAAYVHEQAKRIAKEFGYDYTVFGPKDRQFVRDDRIGSVALNRV